jgi:hypothetical protein
MGDGGMTGERENGKPWSDCRLRERRGKCGGVCGALGKSEK